MDIKDFQLGKVYKRPDLVSAFGGSFMRGMNICKKTDTLVLISKHTRGRIYGDNFQNDLLMYTGEGTTGDQTLSGGNKKLYYSNRDNTPVYLFVVFNKSEYTYYGRVRLYGDIFYEYEKDVNGDNRKVIRFPLRRIDNSFIPLTNEESASIRVSGSTPMIKPTYNVVGAAIFDGDEVLCAQRGYGDLIGKWEFPGGKIEKGESPIEALKREIKEELDIDIEVCDKLDETYYEYPKCNVSLKVYSCKKLSGVIKDTEHKELKWVKAKEIVSLDWADADKPIVDTLVDSLPMDIVENVKFDYFEYKGVKQSDKEIYRANQDYEKAQKKKKVSGAKAEEAVIRYEKDKLNNAGRPDLADMIKQVSVDSPDYGYDVLSFEITSGVAVESHIEVKSAKLTSGFIEFFISANELDKFKTDPAYKIYCLIRFGNSYKLHIVNKNDFFSHEYLTPLTYRVRIRISE